MDPKLSSAAIAIVTVSAFVLFVVASRALAPRAPAKVFAWLAAPLAIAVAFTYVGALRDTLASTFPVGFAGGFAAALISLAVAPVRRAFDEISDRDARVVFSFRAIFGAALFALAALGHLPPSFALTAGVGDLVVGWLALAAPGSLGQDGSRGWRLFVHGAGFLDFLQVAFLAVTVVRPWSLAHANSATAMALPWAAVPLMFAFNVHGIRSAWRARTSDEPSRAGLEPARGVRSALPGA